jgi:hypothetical protein
VFSPKLGDGTYPKIPEDQGLSPITVYGAKAELKLGDIEKLGCGVEGVARTLYGVDMTVAKILGMQWTYNAAMARPGEEPRIPEKVLLQLRESAQIVQNVDKGFVHYLTYFRHDREEVAASMQIEEGHLGEVGWGVFFEQSRHRCMLAVTISGRPEEEIVEDALWVACAEWVNFEPVVGNPKVHKEKFYFPEICTHFFEQDELGDLSGTTSYQSASLFRKEVIERFCIGVRKFVRPFELAPLHEAPLNRTSGYVLHAASSRRFQVADGADDWSCGAPSFVPPAAQWLPGTAPDPGSLPPSGGGLVQFESPIFGGQGEAGTD